MVNLVNQLKRDYPSIIFVASDRACWVASEHKIYYTDDPIDLLHELGHALLMHKDFIQDIELLQMERAAWQKAQQLAPRYGYIICDNDIEEALDSYRNWLHDRSLCPKCNQTGLQSRNTLNYYCLNCHTRWTANDARSCQLRRRAKSRQ